MQRLRDLAATSRLRTIAWHPVFQALAFFTALGFLLVLPAPFARTVVNPGDLSYFYLPGSAARPPGFDATPQLRVASDWWQVFGPDRFWIHQVLAAGHLPLWNPGVFGGWPEFGSQQGGTLSPFSLLEIAFPIRGTALSIVLKVVCGGLGTYALGRTWGMSRAGAITSGVAFASGTYFVDWIFHPHTAAYALLPWALLGITRLASDRPSARDLAITCAALALMWLSGHPQSAAICTAYIAVYAITCVAVTRPTRSIALLTGASVVIGIGIAAIQIVPLEQMLKLANNADRGGKVGPSLRSLWTLAVPDWWGNPSTARDLQQTQPGSLSNYFERTLYVGVPSLFLVVLGMTRWSKAPFWIRLFLITTIPVAILLSFNVHGVSKEIVSAPGLKAVSLTRVLLILSFALAMLAGFGVDAVRRTRMSRRFAAGCTVAAVVVCVLLELKVPGRSGQFPQDFAPAVTRFAILAVVTLAVVWLVSAFPGRRREAAIALMLLVALDLGLHGRGLLPRQSITDANPPSTGAIQALRTLQGTGRIVSGPGSTLQSNNHLRYGLRSANGRGVPVASRIADASTAFGQPTGQGSVGFTPYTPRAGEYLVQQAVTAVLTDMAAPIPGTVPAYGGPDGAVLRVTDPTPRASIVSSWDAVPGQQQAVAALRGQNANAIRNRPVIETSRRPPNTARRAIPASITRDDPNDVTVTLPRNAGGYLILRDTYFPGWQATVDGRRVTIEAAGVDQRAVALPRGARTVRFAYRPAQVETGAWISLASLLLAAGISLAWRRRRRRAG